MNFLTAVKACWQDCCGDKVNRSAKFQSLYDAYWMYLLVVGLYFFVLFMSITHSNFLLDKVIQGNSLYFLCFLALWAYSLYSFISLRNSNPGYISAIKFEPSDEKEDEKPVDPKDSSVRRRKKEDKPVPPKDIPIRAKWCRRCEAFIAKHDHHCFWIGICVGEKNHYHFIRFLVMQIVFIALALCLALNGAYHKFWQFQALPANSIPMYLIGSIVLICIGSFAGFFLIWIPSIMLSYHIYLVGTNQTSYETARPYKCQYLKDLPKDSQKFDQGVWDNYKELWTSTDPKFIEWKVSDKPHPGNCCKSLCCLCINDKGDCCCD